jgi:hypothetical protein
MRRGCELLTSSISVCLVNVMRVSYEVVNGASTRFRRGGVEMEEMEQFPSSSARVHHHAESYDAVSPVGWTLGVKSHAQLIRRVWSTHDEDDFMGSSRTKLVETNYPALRGSVQGRYVQHLAWG